MLFLVVALASSISISSVSSINNSFLLGQFTSLSLQLRIKGSNLFQSNHLILLSLYMCCFSANFLVSFNNTLTVLSSNPFWYCQSYNFFSIAAFMDDPPEDAHGLQSSTRRRCNVQKVSLRNASKKTTQALMMILLMLLQRIQRQLLLIKLQGGCQYCFQGVGAPQAPTASEVFSPLFLRYSSVIYVFSSIMIHSSFSFLPFSTFINFVSLISCIFVHYQGNNY